MKKDFVDIDKVEFEKLKKPEIRLLLKALDIDENNLVCRYCHKKVGLDKVSVMPSFDSKKTAIITCDSPLCIGEYIQECEESKEKHEEEAKSDKARKEIAKEIFYWFDNNDYLQHGEGSYNAFMEDYEIFKKMLLGDEE